jgi:hypothetical protein
VGVDLVGLVGRADGGGEGRGLVAGREIVMGDARRQPRAAALLLHAVLERPRQREVQLGVLAGQQVVVDDLAQQRVAEGVVALVVGRDDVAAAASRRARAARRLEARGLGQQRVVQAAAAEITRRTSCASCGSASMRTMSASRSVGGSSPRPSRPAASSSSVKSGLPSLRAYMRATRRRRGGAEDVLELLGQLVARERRELDAPRARPRSSSASSGRSGWRRCSSSER